MKKIGKREEMLRRRREISIFDQTKGERGNRMKAKKKKKKKKEVPSPKLVGKKFIDVKKRRN